MRISLEISMYPFSDDYIPPILSFIELLNAYEALEVRTNGMSTQVFGEFDAVMNAYIQSMKQSMLSYEKLVFVTKILSTDVSGYKA